MPVRSWATGTLGEITFNRSIGNPDPERSRYGVTGIVGITLR
ncbi:MAG TPA: hypothetical protein VII49_12905 [Rhizomicrobium sp.]